MRPRLTNIEGTRAERQPPASLESGGPAAPRSGRVASAKPEAGVALATPGAAPEKTPPKAQPPEAPASDAPASDALASDAPASDALAPEAPRFDDDEWEW